MKIPTILFPISRRVSLIPITHINDCQQAEHNKLYYSKLIALIVAK